VTVSEKLDGIRHDPELRPLLPRLFVLPGLHLQAPLDKDAPSFLEILGRILSGPSPDGDIDEGGFLLTLSVFARPDAIQGNPEIGDGGSVFGFSELGLASQVSDECDTIVTAHVFIKT
jgi:hypothetical protein